jgi:hypothetical protein
MFFLRCVPTRGAEKIAVVLATHLVGQNDKKNEK